MTAWTCGDLRDAAAEVALDDLIGAERAAALGHLSGCADCRAVVADLSAVADSLLLLAPTIEPSAGFESRVVARLQPAVPVRRPWLLAVAAATIAVVSGAAGVAVAGLDDEDRGLPAAGVLHGADGQVAGSVVVADDPDRMTCVFEDERFGGAYDVEVVLADGSTATVGAFSAGVVPWTWTVPLPVDADAVRVVRVLSTDGVVRASADLG